MTNNKTYKLDLTVVLNAIDRKNYNFYNNLTDEERKSYTPLIYMRYLSSLADQNPNAAYAVIATNDIVNIGFWNLSKHPELQHKLLCLSSLGTNQYHPWISSSKKRKKGGKIIEWLAEQYPELNEDELELIKSSFDTESWTSFVKQSGATDSEVKQLTDAWKKQ